MSDVSNETEQIYRNRNRSYQGSNPRRRSAELRTAKRQRVL